MTEADSEKDETYEDSACDTLSLLGHIRSDEYVARVVSDLRRR